MATASSPVREVLQQLVELYVVYWAIEKLMDLLKVSMRIPPKFCSKQVKKNAMALLKEQYFILDLSLICSIVKKGFSHLCPPYLGIICF